MKALSKTRKNFSFNFDSWDSFTNPDGFKNYATNFSEDLLDGEFFTYSEQHTPQEISNIFDEIGKGAVYCKPRSYGYSQFGCETMQFSSTKVIFSNPFEAEMAKGSRKREVELVNRKKAVKESIYHEDRIRKITFVGDDIAIIETEAPKQDDFYTEPIYYQSSLLKDGKWDRISEISFNYDQQILISLGQKYDGCNSQFASFAIKMLGMK